MTPQDSPLHSSLQSYYSARAPEYDAIYLKPERQPDLRAIEAWLPPIFASAQVLELACGTGYWTRFIAPVAAHVLAIDAAPETLRIARARASNATVEFEVGDAYAPPHRAGGFDAAFAGFWFSHVPRARQREFLLALNATLRPGARVVLLDNLWVDGSSTPIAARNDDDDAGDTFQTRKLADGSSHRVLKNFPSEDELQSLVRGTASAATYTAWPYYWAFDYTVAAP